MKTFATFCLLFTVLHHQHSQGEANDIWNGTVRYAEGIEYMCVASIVLKNYGDDPTIPVHICSGVLITKKHVLTLAHCINEVNDLKDVKVKLGFKDVRYTAQYKIKAWTTYKFWAKDNDINIESSLEHDISIIKLNRKVEWLISPAVITYQPKKDFYEKQVDTAVWGTTEEDRTAMVLRVAKLHVISYDECMKELSNTQLMTKIHKVDGAYLCTKINLGAVLEDFHSGSPLMYKNELIAINDPTYLQRHGIPIPTNLNFHVGLDYYRTFITNVTQAKCATWWRWKRN